MFLWNSYVSFDLIALDWEIPNEVDQIIKQVKAKVKNYPEVNVFFKQMDKNIYSLIEGGKPYSMKMDTLVDIVKQYHTAIP